MSDLNELGRFLRTGLSPSVEPQEGLAGFATSIPSAGDIMFEALKQVNSWLCSVADCDMDEIVADGGITAAMVVRQEAAHQQRKVRRAIAQAIDARSGETAGLGPKGESAVGNADVPGSQSEGNHP